MGAGLSEAVRPAIAAIELGDEHQPAVIRGVQMPGEFGDLGFELANRELGWRR